MSNVMVDQQWSFSYMMPLSGAPARTVGWRDPGFIHTSFLKELWPNTRYVFYPCVRELCTDWHGCLHSSTEHWELFLGMCTSSIRVALVFT